MDFAIVICIFSLVGFESATTLGGEAKRRCATCRARSSGAF